LFIPNESQLLCFVIPAVKSGGITLVVKPYRAQIGGQLQLLELKAPIFSVQKLLTFGKGSNEDVLVVQLYMAQIDGQLKLLLVTHGDLCLQLLTHGDLC
jgi:hypothetical protein